MESRVDDGVVAAIEELVEASRGLVVVTTVRASGMPHSTVVNAGPVVHPATGEPAVGLVAVGGSLKLRHLRQDPRGVVVFRDGPRWLAVEGVATLVGPDDPYPGVPAEDVPGLLRDIYRAAGGGEHPDWDEFDTVMARERRTAVYLGIGRTYGVYPR
jgi:PPOX class probable F420-dependent enzyme